MVEYLVIKKDRVKSIIDGTEDKFGFEHQEIEDIPAFKDGIFQNRELIPYSPFGEDRIEIDLQRNRLAGLFVRQYSGMIGRAAEEFDLSPDFLKAVIYTEISRGWYDALRPLRDDPVLRHLPYVGASSTVLPGNVHRDWEILLPGSNANRVQDNLRLAAKLLKEIRKRLDHPHPEDVYSLYNSLSHDRTYHNDELKSTPFYLKTVLETKAWEYEDWRLHHAFPAADGLPQSRDVLWSGRRAPPAPEVPLDAPKQDEEEWRRLLGPEVPPTAPKAREGEVEGGLLLPREEDAPKRRSSSPRGFHLLKKSELEAPGGAKRAARIGAARQERLQAERGKGPFERVPHFRRLGGALVFDVTRPNYPTGRSLLTSARIDNDLQKRIGLLPPDPAFRLPRRRTAEEILTEDKVLTQLGKGSSFAEVAGDYLANIERDAAFHELERQEEDWIRASLTDPLVGGLEGPKKRTTARSALNAFGDLGLYHFLDDSGLGNYPEVIRLFYRVGELITPRPMYPTVNPPD